MTAENKEKNIENNNIENIEQNDDNIDNIDNIEQNDDNLVLGKKDETNNISSETKSLATEYNPRTSFDIFKDFTKNNALGISVVSSSIFIATLIFIFSVIYVAAKWVEPRTGELSMDNSAWLILFITFFIVAVTISSGYNYIASNVSQYANNSESGAKSIKEFFSEKFSKELFTSYMISFLSVALIWTSVGFVYGILAGSIAITIFTFITIPREFMGDKQKTEAVDSSENKKDIFNMFLSILFTPFLILSGILFLSPLLFAFICSTVVSRQKQKIDN